MVREGNMGGWVRQGLSVGIVIILMSATRAGAAVYVDAWVDAAAHVNHNLANIDDPPRKYSTFGTGNFINASVTLDVVNAFASAGGTLTVNTGGITVSGGGSYNRGTALGTAGCEFTGHVIFQVTSTQTAPLTITGGFGQYTISGPSVNETYVFPVPGINKTFTPGKYEMDFLIIPTPPGGSSATANSQFSLPISMVAPEPSSLAAVGAVLAFLARRQRRGVRAV
jgi:hypothetical protein